MPAKPGSIVHIELHSADPTKSKQFYSQVFGWKFQDMPEMNYSLWSAPSEPAGGLMHTMEGRPPQVLNYILSKSIDADVQKITQAGGAILMPKQEIPNQGWWAMFQEPGGTVQALYENLPKPRAAARPKPAKRSAKRAKAGKRRK